MEQAEDSWMAGGSPFVWPKVLDAMAELTNIIIGSFKTNVEEELGPMGLSIPTVIHGRNFTTRTLSRNDWTRVPFQCEGGGFNIHVCLAPNRRHPTRRQRPGHALRPSAQCGSYFMRQGKGGGSHIVSPLHPPDAVPHRPGPSPRPSSAGSAPRRGGSRSRGGARAPCAIRPPPWGTAQRSWPRSRRGWCQAGRAA